MFVLLFVLHVHLPLVSSVRPSCLLSILLRSTCLPFLSFMFVSSFLCVVFTFHVYFIFCPPSFIFVSHRTTTPPLPTNKPASLYDTASWSGFLCACLVHSQLWQLDNFDDTTSWSVSLWMPSTLPQVPTGQFWKLSMLPQPGFEPAISQSDVWDTTKCANQTTTMIVGKVVHFVYYKTSCSIYIYIYIFKAEFHFKML